MASLYQCRAQLRGIINELREIEWGIRRGFTGIGENLCADCIDRIAEKYDGVMRRLNSVDTNKIADWINGDC